jgi:hypothetical protein
MKLMELHAENIEAMLNQHDVEGGNQINRSLSKLFQNLNDEQNRYEVMIKVAALNQIYSTSIQYIAPVVDRIIDSIGPDHSKLSIEGYSNLVDKIASVSWKSPTTGKNHTRTNLSFSSKYVHFLSERKVPIYDSYIWILLVGYNRQAGLSNYNFSPPVSYKYFFKAFNDFRSNRGLDHMNYYDLDKCLWQYGKNLLSGVIDKEKVSMDKAKSILKQRIGNSCSGPA